MWNLKNFKIEIDESRVLTATLDVPERSVNVFDDSVLTDLSIIVDYLLGPEAADLSFVVFQSGKNANFLAGADIHRIRGVKDRDECDRLIRVGQDLFQRLASSPVPTLALINGVCVGGGLEFALACQYRIGVNHSATKLGLPEVKLGLIPAWGGTQRLPKLIGLSAALPMLLQGNLLSAEAAFSVGLIDEIVEAEDIQQGVQTFIRNRLKDATTRNTTMNWKRILLDSNGLGRRATIHGARRQIEKESKNYPALEHILQAAEIGASTRDVTEEGLKIERTAFWELLSGTVAPELIYLFLNQDAAKKTDTWLSVTQDAHQTQRRIQKIAVIGAGTMGAGIAQLAAARGLSVVLQDVQPEAIKNGMQLIQKLFHQAVQKDVLSKEEAQLAESRIQTRTAWEKDDDIDLMIEAIVERLEVKQALFAEALKWLPANAILASNTSALPIDQLLHDESRTGQIAGMHFFNPVHKMALIEIVRTRETSDQTLKSLVELSKTLGKIPVVVQQSPGFLVNRILFPYLDEAVRLYHEGYPKSMIENAAKRFGMPMGPLELLDVVGIDVALDVSRTLKAVTVSDSPTPALLAEMVSNGQFGKKSGKGFYNWNHGVKSSDKVHEESHCAEHHQNLDHWTVNGELLDVVQQRLVLAMVNESQKCLNENLVSEPWMIDLAMVLGTGFPPFRGGPMACVRNWSAMKVKRRLETLRQNFGERFHPAKFDLEVVASEI